MQSQKPIKPPRRLLQISCPQDLHDKIRDHCKRLDIPMGLWARELIKQELLSNSES